MAKTSRQLRYVRRLSREPFEDRLCLSPVAFASHEFDHARASSMFAIDMDNDGDVDVLSEIDEGIVWYENIDGEGTFGEHKVVALETGVSFVNATDVDGDGDVDVISQSGRYPLPSRFKIVWYENMDGKGTFSEPRVVASETEGNSVHVADVDSDGDVDIVSTNGGNIIWYENVGEKGTFSEPHIVAPIADRISSLSAVDMDADDDVDLLTFSRQDDNISWYEHVDGKGRFGEKAIIAVDVKDPLLVFATDIDGDGDNDVVATSTRDNKVSWFENMDEGRSFAAQHVILTGQFDVHSISATDVDSDGDTDLLMGSSDGHAMSWLSWLENADGQGTFSQHVMAESSALISGLVSATAADLDGDNDVDVVWAFVSAFGFDKIGWHEQLPQAQLGDANHDGIFDQLDIVLPAARNFCLNKARIV